MTGENTASRLRDYAERWGMLFEFLGGKYRPSYRPLNDAIIAGRFRGACAIVGCNNPKV